MSKQRKLLFVVTNADIGGAQNHINSLIRHMSDSYELVLLAGSDGRLLDEVRDLGVVVRIIPKLQSKLFIPALMSLRREIKSEQPDIIHTHSAIASFVGRIAGRLAGVKTLYTVHGWHFVPNSVWKRRVFGWLLELFARPFTSAWITVSNYDARLGIASGVVDRRRVWSIPNGVSDEPLAFSQDANNGLKLVFIGRASYQKNCLEAIDILTLCRCDVTLDMYVTSGDHLDELRYKIDSSDVADRVSIIADNPDAANALRDYGILLLTSRYEGMPLCVLEAMRSGLAVVTSDVCGMSELVRHNETGFLYDLGNVGQAAEFVDALNDSQLRDEFAQNARMKFTENHLAEMMAQRTVEVYETLLSEY